MRRRHIAPSTRPAICVSRSFVRNWHRLGTELDAFGPRYWRRICIDDQIGSSLSSLVGGCELVRYAQLLPVVLEEHAAAILRHVERGQLRPQLTGTGRIKRAEPSRPLPFAGILIWRLQF
jgi:hypothetical protein